MSTGQITGTNFSGIVQVPAREQVVPVSGFPDRISAASGTAFRNLHEENSVNRKQIHNNLDETGHIPEDPEKQLFRLVLQESLDVGTVLALLKSRPDIAVKIDSTGKNILHYLLERQSSPNIGAIISFILGKMSPEDISACNFFLSIVQRGKIAITALIVLLSKGVKPAGLQQLSPEFRQKIVKNIVRWVCDYPDDPRFSEAIRECIKDYPGLTEETDSEGNTLLHIILGYYKKSSEGLNHLIKDIIKSMRPETINSYNRTAPGSSKGYETPLQRYSKNIYASPEIIACLLDAGANPLLLSKWYRSIEYVEDILKVLDERKIQDPNREHIWELLAGAANVREYEGKTLRPSLLPGPEGASSLPEREKFSYWSDQAIRYVRYTAVIGAPNNYDDRKTGGWSVKIAHEWLQPSIRPYNERLIELCNSVSPRYKARELLAARTMKRAAMLTLTRGGGDCFMQASLGFVYLYNHGLPVEYFNMEGDIHEYLVFGRDPKSNKNDPLSWGPLAIICDPWTGFTLPASEWNVPSQFDDIKEGTPLMLFNHETVNNMSEQMRAILLEWGIELIPVEDPLSERKYTIRFRTPMLSSEEQAIRQEYFAGVHAKIPNGISILKAAQKSDKSKSDFPEDAEPKSNFFVSGVSRYSGTVAPHNC